MRLSSLTALLAVAVLGSSGCADSSRRSPAGPTAPTSPGTAACTFEIDTTQTTFDASGGMGSAAITTGPACRWNVYVGNSPWIKTDPVTFTGPAVVEIAIDPNRTFNSRSALLQIRDDKGAFPAGQLVIQRAAGCLYRIAPRRLQRDWLGTSDGSDVGAFVAQVHAEPSDCRWTVTSGVPWMFLTRYSQTSGTGDGTIYVSILWNGDPDTRVGEIVIAGLSGVNPDAHLVVTQTGRQRF